MTRFRFINFGTFISAVFVGLLAVALYALVLNNPFAQEEATSTPLPSIDSKVFTPPQVDETNPEAFDPEGIYEATKNNEIKGFEIKNKNLSFDCDDARFGTLTEPKLFVTDKNDVVFEAPVLRAENGVLNFVSETKDGTKYIFEGDFLVKGNFYTLDPEKKVVSGKLLKFVGGKKVAETALSFTWSIDLDCVC